MSLYPQQNHPLMSSPTLFDEELESEFMLDLNSNQNDPQQQLHQHHWLTFQPHSCHDESLFNDDDLVIMSNHHFNDDTYSMDQTQRSESTVASWNTVHHWNPTSATLHSSQTHSQHLPSDQNVTKYWNMAEEDDEWLTCSEIAAPNHVNTDKKLQPITTNDSCTTSQSHLIIRTNKFVARPFTELIIEEGEAPQIAVVSVPSTKTSQSNSQVSSHLNMVMEQDPIVPVVDKTSSNTNHSVTELDKEASQGNEDSSTEEEEDPDYIEEEETREEPIMRKTRQSIKRKRTLVCDSSDDEESQEMQASTSSSMLSKPSKKEKKLRKKKQSKKVEESQSDEEENIIRTMDEDFVEQFNENNHGNTFRQSLTVVPHEMSGVSNPHLKVDLTMPCIDMYVKPSIFVKNGVSRRDDSRSSIFTVTVSLQGGALNSRVKLENLRLLVVSDKKTKRTDGERVNVKMIKNSNASSFSMYLNYLEKDPNDNDLLSILQIEEYQDKYVFKCQVSTSNNASGWKNKHSDYKMLVFDQSDSEVFGGISQGFKVAKAPKSQKQGSNHSYDTPTFNDHDDTEFLSNVFIHEGKKKRKLQISEPTIVKHCGKSFKITVQEISEEQQ
ncbi:hypothetical protein C9374_002807 [Naegleria lovaniensis]|uniref:Uncharacterized protein n=1 Tax=Naegleria lovaniensis TaxID=51637 RepID=A0AA88GV24_NAELO|nr:uncharacterized protein C9374_002807 [Naegleria lovaniensis]KAG2386361.1 hypothetical protein C9374_002807 [Naegleria lovaniensis]